MGKLTLLAILVAIAICVYLMVKSTYNKEHSGIQAGGRPGERYYTMPDGKAGDGHIEFNLLDPETAPEAKVAMVTYGYHIVIDTKLNAPEYTGNSLDCRNCHFNGGNLLGGKNRGISLVGVTAKYPHYSKRTDSVITLPQRVNMCFTNSMNGKPLPYDSLQMEGILAYLAWISHEVLDAPSFPWLGLPRIHSNHKPNAQSGEKIYRRHCALCHGKNGEGSQGVPPLWGDQSYNARAGMNKIPIFASFVYQNMPYGQPILNPEESLDVAAYVAEQPRPLRPQ